jgi:hypothetical protein
MNFVAKWKKRHDTISCVHVFKKKQALPVVWFTGIGSNFLILSSGIDPGIEDAYWSRLIDIAYTFKSSKIPIQ